MKTIIFSLLLQLISLEVLADDSIFKSLSKLSALTNGFNVIEMPNGIDLKSQETFKNSSGETEPVTHMELEGAFDKSQFNTLEKGIDFLITLIKPEIDQTYTIPDSVLPGLNVSIVDVNGTKVGLLDYKMNKEPNTYTKRAVILKDKGLYSYCLTMHKSKPKDKKGLLLMTAVIATVDSSSM